jgi:hypothetical protein
MVVSHMQDHALQLTPYINIIVNSNLREQIPYLNAAVFQPAPSTALSITVLSCGPRKNVPRSTDDHKNVHKLYNESRVTVSKHHNHHLPKK